MDTLHFSASPSLSIDFQEQGQPSLEINVQTFDDGEIEIRMTSRRLVIGDDGRVDDDRSEVDSWDTNPMPKEVGLRLRDFLNYAYPAGRDS